MWLSHFLTIPGESFCGHEGTEYAGSAEEFWDNAEQCCKQTGAEIYGNSDSASIFVLPALLAARPLTRVVWIERPIVEVAKSMKAIGMPFDEKALRNLMYLRSKYAEHMDMVVGFDQLQSGLVCKQVWEFCLPGLPFDWGRWQKFNDQKIGYSKEHPMPPKNFQKFLAWVKRELDEKERSKI